MSDTPTTLGADLPGDHGVAGEEAPPAGDDEQVEQSEEVSQDESNDPGAISQAKRQAEAQTYRGAHLTVSPLPQPAPPLLGPSAFTEAKPDSPLARVAHANAHARTTSIDQLGEWFPGYDFAAAAQTSDDRRFTVLEIGSSLYEHLNAIETVERVMSQHDLVGRRVVFSNGSGDGTQPDRVFEPASSQARRLRVGPLVDAITQQWTTILNGIDALDPAIAQVCEHMERVYGCRINTNCYVSFGQAEGFGHHWDNHDTIIVPAAGSKKWTIYEPTALSPERPWVGDDVSPRPVWEGEIKPGMCLVIPRGWGHAVGGSDDLAIHYTIGVNRLTVRNALERLIIEGGYQPIVRADLAYDPSAPVSSYDKSIHDGPDDLSTIVGDLATPDLIDRAIATYRARMPLRLFPRMFEAWTTAGAGDWEGAKLRIPVPAGMQVMGFGPGGVVLAFGDQRIELTPAAFEIVSALASTDPIAIEDLPASDDDDEAVRTQICSELVRAGLADVFW